MVQLREKDLNSRELFDLGARIQKAMDGKAKFIVNDRVDVAMALNADGVQLPEAGIPATAARRIVGPDMLIGRSVHSVAAAVEAESDGADFLIAGTIFPSTSHPDVPARGIDFLRFLTGKVSLPVLAIGGITTQNVSAVMETGAAGVAVISAISEAEHPGAAADSLLDLMTMDSTT